MRVAFSRLGSFNCRWHLLYISCQFPAQIRSRELHVFAIFPKIISWTTESEKQIVNHRYGTSSHVWRVKRRLPCNALRTYP